MTCIRSAAKLQNVLCVVQPCARHELLQARLVQGTAFIVLAYSSAPQLSLRVPAGACNTINQEYLMTDRPRQAPTSHGTELPRRLCSAHTVHICLQVHFFRFISPDHSERCMHCNQQLQSTYFNNDCDSRVRCSISVARRGSRCGTRSPRALLSTESSICCHTAPSTAQHHTNKAST